MIKTIDQMPFIERLSCNIPESRSLDTLQINLGKYCNQACMHCHVEAGPTRVEMMNLETMNAVLDFLARSAVLRVDITGGAPELNPVFKNLVHGASLLKLHVMVRSNLTVLLEPGKEDLPIFFRDRNVHIMASLPCYTQNNVDRQRGNGVFEKSIKALQQLNALGYGEEGTGLILDLVYNPLGDFLPPNQKNLEQDYKKRLKEDFNIGFNQLYTLTNMPILRFRRYLKGIGRLDTYMQLLSDNFNPDTLESLMCRNMISVDWHGFLYDCDFNQMLEMPLKREDGTNLTIFDCKEEDLIYRRIQTGDHCYACTAGSGSSCGGTLI